MKIILASDHRGFALKEELKTHLTERGLDVYDVGNITLDQQDDYPDFASVGADIISKNPGDNLGVFLCGSGHGMDIVANKYEGVRAALGFNDEVTKQSREHDDANVLVLPADWVSEEEAKNRVDIWLETRFSGEERHRRRLDKVREIEGTNI